MDPIRNPYAPGAGQRPPELAGRDRELEQFEITLERVAAGRPERSMVLSGLRGVGKTVLLNALRGQAVRRAWGTGKIEARPERSLRVPVAQAVHAAVREVAHRHRDPDRVDEVAGVLKSYALRTTLTDRKGLGWVPPLDVPATKGRADSGDLELDLLELFTDVASLARDLGVGIGLFVDEMQDIEPSELAALCGACHEISQQGAPLVVVGAGLPHLPVALAASKSYAERLFRYVSVDRLPREMADRAWRVPAAEEGVDFEPGALDELYRLTDGYPYFVQAYGKVVWDAAVGSPITVADVAEAAPLAEAELAIGFFGARYERATPAERDYMTAMADLGADGDGPVATAEVARHLDRKPQSLSPARDGLIKKGLVYSGERGSVAFTVPHFGRFLRAR
ncbi:AAA family ATPase [Nocardioides sp. zg-579]|uniref:AAA family ATPase n=1 Tax=Nocardioides marmotae TaxID=2663857 RepID=A0A6I3JDF7_9ACTN|nr:ATP-binding protein [Nocardioides marmotae]MCR6032545.1 AAA family ATPase [Gordonia jinghuaiqii]MTB96194.1 AAA family ATPase [Nocardioides marmotae]QKD99733.1 ATP-binding protein [Nocardioides marmotae]